MININRYILRLYISFSIIHCNKSNGGFDEDIAQTTIKSLLINSYCFRCVIDPITGRERLGVGLRSYSV